MIITRGNNVFGPHQYPEKVIPKFIRRMVNGEGCCIHGDGSNSRHFVFVKDVAQAFDTIMHKGVDGETYNSGCHDELTTLEVARKIVESVHPGVKDADAHITFVEDRPFNDVRYYLNFDKLQLLGWSPQVPFEDGLKQTIAWYKQVAADWWDCGTDSALAAHPKPVGAPAPAALQ